MYNKYIKLLSLVLLVLVPFGVQAKATFDYPRTANYFLDSYVHPDEARLLAPWDLLILSVSAQDWKPEVFKVLREANPDIIILAYVSGTGISATPKKSEFPLQEKLGYSVIPKEWHLKSSSQQTVSYWPGSIRLNYSNLSPKVNNERWNEYLPRVIAEDIYATGLWDGIFIDEAFGALSWLNGGDIDLDNDGQAEDKATIDVELGNGLNTLLANLRARLGADAQIVVNGSSNYMASTNGRMHENSFRTLASWPSNMKSYLKAHQAGAYSPKLSIVNSNTSNTGNINNQQREFAFASTLLGDGFFSYDFGDQKHMNIWWNDLYDVNLGQPLNKAYNVFDVKDSVAKPSVWRRDFTYGSVLVNSGFENIEYQVTMNGQTNTETLVPFSGKIITNAQSIKILPDQVEPTNPIETPSPEPEPEPEPIIKPELPESEIITTETPTTSPELIDTENNINSQATTTATDTPEVIHKENTDSEILTNIKNFFTRIAGFVQRLIKLVF